MKLPMSFKVGRSIYSVVPAHSQTNYYGRTTLSLCMMQISTRHKGKPRKPQDIAETFWHEVTHAILYDMYHPQWSDEAFVTAFSKRLTQVIYTARFS